MQNSSTVNPNQAEADVTKDPYDQQKNFSERLDQIEAMMNEKFLNIVLKIQALVAEKKEASSIKRAGRVACTFNIDHIPKEDNSSVLNVCKTEKGKKLGAYLHHKADSVNISYDTNVTIRLLGSPRIVESKSFFSNEWSSRGWPFFIHWSKLVNFTNGFVDGKGNFKFEVEFSVTGSTITCALLNPQFLTNGFVESDYTLLVEGRRFPVNKGLLAAYSNYFKTLFFGEFREKYQDQIELKETCAKEFLYLLKVIYPPFSDADVNQNSLESLLRLADFYQMKVVLDRCSQYLKRCAISEISLHDKLVYAQNYHLSELLENCIKEYKTFDDVKKLRAMQKSRSSSENVEENLAERSTELVLHQPQTLVKKRKRSMANSQNVIGKKKKLSEKEKRKRIRFLAMTEKNKMLRPVKQEPEDELNENMDISGRNVSEDSLNLTLSPLDLNLSHDQQASNVSSGPEDSLLTSEETSPSPSSRKDATYQYTEQSDQSQDTSEDFVLKRCGWASSRTNDKEDMPKRSQRLQQLKPGYKQLHRSPSRSLLEKQSSDDEDFPLEEILAEHVVNGKLNISSNGWVVETKITAGLTLAACAPKTTLLNSEKRKKVEKEAAEKAKKEAEKQTARAAKLAAASVLAKRPRASSCNRVAKSVFGTIVLLKTRNQNNQKKSSSHRRLTDGKAEHDLDQFKLRLEKLSKEIADGYDQLESEAKLLPAQTPIFSLTNRLNQFLLDIATSSSSVESYMNSRDAFDWSSSTNEYTNYVCEFLKSSVRLNADRFTYKHLEKSAISSVLEIKLISTYNPNMYKGKEQHGNQYVPLDKQVCIMKMLLLINNGVFEYIQFIAPHEDWTYLETSRKQIDLSAESQYELYQRLTVQGNILINMITSTSPCDKNGISMLLGYVSKYYNLDQPCKHCKKILKNFCPATLSDNRKMYHLTCK
uniref:BTB domain-containing protein n=1 Tax=Ditylenchus dipsaci TaxID=166011 RepID=A0A915D619_9BILA